MVDGDVPEYKFCECRQVFIHSCDILDSSLPDGMRVTRAGRVDKDEVRFVQQAEFVWNDLERRIIGRLGAVRKHPDRAN